MHFQVVKGVKIHVAFDSGWLCSHGSVLNCVVICYMIMFVLLLMLIPVSIQVAVAHACSSMCYMCSFEVIPEWSEFIDYNIYIMVL